MSDGPGDTRPIRPGEELPLDRLTDFLVGAGLCQPDDEVLVEQFPSGHSNLTYLVRFGETEMVLRRPPFGTRVKTAHDMVREHRVLAALAGSYSKAPRPVALCEDPAVIGAPFYLMQRVRGVVLRGTAPPALANASPEEMRRVSEGLIDSLVELHAVDVTAPAFAALGHPGGYVRRQVEGWTRRYEGARTDDIPAMERVTGWLAEHLPAERAAALVHNDYKYDNVVLDPGDLGRVVAVLDWEMATVGDPLLDLGTTLGYWVDAGDPEDLRSLPFGPTARDGNLQRLEIVRRYAERSGRPVGADDLVFYYAFALVKIAVIAQQIYRRYVEGHTRDARFEGMIGAVKILARTGERAIDRHRIG